MVIDVIDYLLLGIYLFLLVEFVLNLFQQNHYHFDVFKSIFLKYYFKSFNLIIGILYIFNRYLIIRISIILLFLILIFFRKKRIIKLKYTKRIKRLVICIVILNFTLYWLRVYLVVVEYFIILLGILLMLPIEWLINKYYYKEAKKKLERIDLLKIAITGSYGKTSTKQILYEILKNDFLCVVSPLSYNTVMGLSLFVNNDLKKFHKIGIFEYGASRKKDIRKLNKLVKADYGVITEIGPQHLKTFKSIENIVSEKMSLQNLVKGKIFVNYDNEYIKNSVIESDNVVKVGMGENVEFRAQNIRYNQFGVKFQLVSRKEIYEIESELLGKHQVTNIMLAGAVSEYLGVKKEVIEESIKGIKSDKNRLCLKKINSHLVLDDSFNSNIKGFRNALEVLGMYEKYRVLITPGIVEGGKKEEIINYELNNDIAKNCDFVILIRNKASEYIKKGLDDIQYNSYIEVDSFIDGFNKYQEINNDKIVLIENDISDLYKI